MKFINLLKTIKAQLPHTPEATHQRAFLDQLQTRILDIREKIGYKEVSAKYPITLTNNEILTLIEIAVLNKLFISQGEKRIALLTILIDMGTWLDGGENIDSYLGLKEERFQTFIAEKAKEEVLRRKKNSHLIRQKSAIFGSSVNPPTLNHLAFIKHLIEKGYFVYIIPNALSPLKPTTWYAPQEHRYKMIELALANNKNISKNNYHLETLEIDRCPPSRMFMTISALTLLSEPSEEFTLALTMDDNFIEFNKWFKWEEFGYLCAIKFYSRPGITSVIAPHILQKTFYQLLEKKVVFSVACATVDEMQSMQNLLGSFSTEVMFEVDDLATQEGSATSVRAHFKENKEGQPTGITSEIYNYIKNNKLYGVS